MKSIKKYLLIIVLCLLLAVFCLSITASAQINYYNADKAVTEKLANATAQSSKEAPPEKAKSFTVTSIQKCYDLLSREDVLEIQQNYIKPYKECQRRVALKLKEKQKKKSGDDVKNESTSKSQYGFYRVQKKTKHTSESSKDKPSP